MPEKPTDKDKNLRTAVTLLRAALETAPNPHIVNGPPAMWEWYDGVRANTLDLTKEL